MTHTCPKSPFLHVCEYIYGYGGGGVEEVTEQKCGNRSKNSHLHRVDTLWKCLRDMACTVLPLPTMLGTTPTYHARYCYMDRTYRWHGSGPWETPIRALRGVVWAVHHCRGSKGSTSGRDGRGDGILGVLGILGILAPSSCPCMHFPSGQPCGWNTQFGDCWMS